VPRRAHNRLPRSRYVDGVEILYIATNGPSDATKASIPWHIAVNGSVEVGQTARIVLAGDAAEIVKADVRAALEGVGVPPLRDLVAKATANGVPIHV
jgi:predicted peroxiredoxin